MGHRYSWFLLIAAIGLCQGCHSMSSKTAVQPPAMKPDELTPKMEGSTAEAKELPAAETARVCIATADALYEKGQNKQAIAFYEKARKTDPSQKKVCRRLAVLYDREDNYQQAMVEYQTALELYPKDASLHNDVGYCHYCRGEWTAAETELRKAVELDPANKRAWMNLGLTLAQQSRYDQSLKAFEKAVPPAQAHANIAFVMTAQGKYEDAKTSYDRALKLDPQLKKARDAMGRLDGTERVAIAPPAAPPAPTKPLTSKGVASRSAKMPVDSSPYAPVVIEAPHAPALANLGQPSAFPPPPVVAPAAAPVQATSGSIVFDPE